MTKHRSWSNLLKNIDELQLSMYKNTKYTEQHAKPYHTEHKTLFRSPFEVVRASYVNQLIQCIRCTTCRKVIWLNWTQHAVEHINPIHLRSLNRLNETKCTFLTKFTHLTSGTLRFWFLMTESWSKHTTTTAITTTLSFVDFVELNFCTKSRPPSYLFT